MYLNSLMIRVSKLIALVFIMLAPFAAVVIHAQDATAEATSSPEATKISITLSEYSFQIEGQKTGEALQLKTNTAYEITVKDGGLLNHELLIGTAVKTVNGGFLHDYGTFLLDGVDVEVSGSMNDKAFTIVAPGIHEVQLAPGQEVTLAFTLTDDKAGKWEAGCFNYMQATNNDDNPGPSHYDVGMKLEVDVAQAG
ncbi:MAG: hypothetical protein ABI970_07615 [Chloroflexota bacterium]